MIKDMEYRQAVAEDGEDLVRLWWEVQSAHRVYDPVWNGDRGEEESKASWRERFRGLLGDEGTHIIVASASGTAVGMIVAQFTERPPIFVLRRMVKISTTVVHPGFRQQGIFSGMLSLLERKARAAGIRVIGLNVHNRNAEARTAYEKTGFVPEATSMIKWIEQD